MKIYFIRTLMIPFHIIGTDTFNSLFGAVLELYSFPEGGSIFKHRSFA
jgi:hypothetical protein